MKKRHTEEQIAHALRQAEGGLPVPQQHFVGFSLEQLLLKEDTQPPSPSVYP